MLWDLISDTESPTRTQIDYTRINTLIYTCQRIMELVCTWGRSSLARSRSMSSKFLLRKSPALRRSGTEDIDIFAAIEKIS